MTLVNIVPYVILHQKTHVPWAVNFFESQKASEHPVFSILKYLTEFIWKRVPPIDHEFVPFSYS